MKVWTVILAGLLLAALPNLGNSAREDEKVVVANTYKNFTRRIFPANITLICTTFDNGYEWFQIDKFEKLLLEFENGNNTMNKTFSFATPALLLVFIPEVKFENPQYCKPLPKALKNAKTLRNYNTRKIFFAKGTFEFYAMKINGTGQATITQGWNTLVTLVKNRFPNNTEPSNYQYLVVEKTAAGVIYVGAVQKWMS